VSDRRGPFSQGFVVPSDPIVLGPYRVVRVLGQGGMGIVYEALHERSNETVAVKVISQALAEESHFCRRFHREMHTMMMLKHPNIVQIIGTGEENQLLFYAMEYVDGENLQQRISREKRIPWSIVLDWAIEICGALKHSHNFGIIHRDLKPANLIIHPSGSIKLTDFGVACQHYGKQPRATTPGSVIGTADFMAPEQAEGQDAQPRSDLYSLGAVCYYAITGRTPFTGKSIPEILFNVRYGTYTPLCKMSPNTPNEFCLLVDELLHRNLDERPPNAYVLENRLKALRVGLHRTSEAGTQAMVSGSDGAPSAEDAAADAYDGMTSINMSDYPSMADLSSPDADQGDATRIASRNKHNKQSSDPIPPLAKKPRTSVFPVDEADPHIAGPHEETRVVASGVLKEKPAENPEVTGVNRYREVTERDRERAMLGTDSQLPESHWQQWQGIAGLLALLATCIALALWFSRPPDADSMLRPIQAAFESGDEDRRIEVRDAAAEFLRLYPDHENADRLSRAIDEVDAQLALRQLQRRAALQTPSQLDTIEGPLLDATRLLSSQPAEALKKLDSLLVVFQNRDGLTRRQKQLLHAATITRDQLEKSPSEPVDVTSLAQLEDRVRWAEANLDADNRVAFLRSLILLYADKPWAKPLVESAQFKLSPAPD
jgi:serine/threonine protein kinase